MPDEIWFFTILVITLYGISVSKLPSRPLIRPLKSFKMAVDCILLITAVMTAIWFSPLYDSPWKDYGYDIADYKSIHPSFGTMADFDTLVAECHRRGLKVMMDAVFNHTSNQHAWFKEAIADRDSPYRDYYIIREGKLSKDGELMPPTNWTSSFTGSAWQRIGDTDEFYLHLFAPEQPDLNWENPDVRAEAVSILRFWLEKGVDGFRFDVFNMYSKVYPLKDDKSLLNFQKGTKYYVDGPKMHEYLKEMYDKALSYFDTYTVGESYIPDEEQALKYISQESGELDTIFDFEHFESDSRLKFLQIPFDLRRFKKGVIGPQLRFYGRGWNTLVLENHDNARSVSRFGINTRFWRYEAATLLALVTFMGWGTPFIYQGEEIGMTNSKFSGIDELRDPASHIVYDMLTGKYHVPGKAVFNLIRKGVRDHARTPMQWDDSVNAGFNRGAETWQSVNPEYKDINVKADLASKKSIYRFYQELFRIRQAEPVLLYGETIEYEPDSRRLVIYSRRYNGRRLLIIGNFCEKPSICRIPEDFIPDELDVRLSNYTRQTVRRELALRPYEAMLLEEKQ